MSRYGRAASYADFGPDTTKVSLPALITFALPLTGAARYSTPLSFRIRRSSADPSREMDEHSTTILGLAEPARSLPTTSLTSSHVETMQNTTSRDASSARASTILAPYCASGSAFALVRFHAAMSQPPLARRAAIS